MLLLLHSAFMLSVVKLLLKGEVGVCALNSHENYIVDLGKSWNCVFSSPEPKAQGELIVWDSSRRSCVHTFKHEYL